MRSDRKKPPDTTARAVRVVRGATGAQPSAASRQRIVRITRKAGNDQFGTALGQAAGRRDVLLAFTCSQLEKLHQLQGLELREIRDKHRVRGWYKETAKGALGYRLPDATRFHEAARLYKLTGTALANGELGRGA